MKVFWDTNLFIYLWEDQSRGERMRRELERLREQNCELLISALTIGEILVQPLRRKKPEVADQYWEVLTSLRTVAFDVHAARIFAQLRASYPSLKPPNAIQLACASVEKADEFVTNDGRLKSIRVPAIGRIVSL